MTDMVGQYVAAARDIQSQLGHAELSTTAIYTRVSIRRLKEVHARTHPAEEEAELDEGH